MQFITSKRIMMITKERFTLVQYDEYYEFLNNKSRVMFRSRNVC